jgi:hypothetical protein
VWVNSTVTHLQTPCRRKRRRPRNGPGAALLSRPGRPL